MPTWKDVLQFEKALCVKAWNRLWAYLPFTPKQAGLTLVAYLLTNIIILYVQGLGSLFESWGGLAGLIGTLALLCTALLIFLYEYEMASVGFYLEQGHLKARITELQTPRLRLEFREGDVRYLTKDRINGFQFEDIVQISVHNDSTATIDEVTLHIDDAISSRPLPDTGHLFFDSESFRPRTLTPGDHFFVRLIEGLEGTSFRVKYRPTHNRRFDSLRGEEFLIKLRVGARDVAPVRLILRLKANRAGCVVTLQE